MYNDNSSFASVFFSQPGYRLALRRLSPRQLRFVCVLEPSEESATWSAVCFVTLRVRWDSTASYKIQSRLTNLGNVDFRRLLLASPLEFATSLVWLRASEPK